MIIWYHTKNDLMHINYHNNNNNNNRKRKKLENKK